MVVNADSDNVDYDDGWHGLCIAMITMLLMILKQCFFVTGTEDLVRLRGKGSSMTRTGDDDDDEDRSIININI